MVCDTENVLHCRWKIHMQTETESVAQTEDTNKSVRKAQTEYIQVESVAGTEDTETKYGQKDDFLWRFDAQSKASSYTLSPMKTQQTNGSSSGVSQSTNSGMVSSRPSRTLERVISLTGIFRLSG